MPPSADRPQSAEGDQRFTPSRRLRRSPEFARVFAEGKAVSDAVLLIKGRTGDQPETRLGVSVSRRLGSAVVRNRWKRRLRERFGRHAPNSPPASTW